MGAIPTLKATIRVAAFLAVTAVLVVVFVLACPLGARATIRRLWCRSVCAILGVRWRASGNAFTTVPTLFVANHVSYLDVLLLGCVLDATFIAKREVAGWPLLGVLARLARTLFIRRHWRDARLQRDRIAGRMALNESFILFAEGTSGNGLGVLPFKTSLLSVAEPALMDRPVAVQPVTLAYVREGDGTPFGPTNAERWAWVGDTALLPHLWAMLGGPGIEVEIGIGAPVLSWSVRCRKSLGPRLRAEIGDSLAVLRQRPPPLPARQPGLEILSARRA